MSFDHPALLYFLFFALVFLVVILFRYPGSRKGVSLFAVAAPQAERESLLKELRLRLIASDFFFLLFFCFLIVALAGPRWGERMVPDYHRGVDVVLAFDLSRSMDVRDCPPGSGSRFPSQDGDTISRLERGMDVGRELVASLGDIRLGAAIGKGQGVLAVPLTYDNETISGFLDSIGSQAITGRGTNLESLIDAAAGAFQDSVPSRRSIILFTDGDNLSGSFQAAAERAMKVGITLSAIGLGSDRGGKVPLGNAQDDVRDSAQGSSQGIGQDNVQDSYGKFLLAPDGTPVISARQSSLLRGEAGKSGGIYVDGSRDDAAQLLAAYINSLSSDSRLSGYRREANPRWQIFILAAMVSLGGARMMGFSRRKREPKNTGRAAKAGKIFTALVCLFLFNSCENIQGKLLIMEGNFFNIRGFYTDAISSYLRARNLAAPYAEYGLASAYYALDENDAALERYKAAEESVAGMNQDDHRELRYRIHYNSGIIYFEKGDYGEAVRSFREALKEDSSRIEAKRNLELSLLTIKRNSSPPASSSRSGTENGAGNAGGNSQAIFEFLREMEQEQWKSREWTSESDSSGPDY